MKVVCIEAQTMIEMVSRDILPAVSQYSKVLCDSLTAKRSALGSECIFEAETAKNIDALITEAYKQCRELSDITDNKPEGDMLKSAMYCRDNILPLMSSLRKNCDALEVLTSSRYWPYPTYGELLFSVN
jgi:glutamine synthetase